MYKYKDEKGEHLHLWNGQPLIGTSTVTNRISKGGLTWWASGLACEQYGWLNPKKATEGERLQKAQSFAEIVQPFTAGDWLKLGDKAYKAHMTSLNKSKDKGTDLHAELERFVKDHMGGSVGSYAPQIQPFIDWTEKNVKRFLLSEKHVFSERMWTGGIVDCVAELNDGQYVILDFKSAKEAYPSMFLQVAGYATQLAENGFYDKDGNKLGEIPEKITAIGIVPFGANKVEPVFNVNVEECRKVFENVLELHKFLLQFEGDYE